MVITCHTTQISAETDTGTQMQAMLSKLKETHKKMETNILFFHISMTASSLMKGFLDDDH
jgi:putative IMPACT (imprinted ancient) family translation regulator